MATSLHGFASISRRRTSLKPMIAAINGPAYGGGVEIILNCDLVVASQDAIFGLPEVKRGVMAAQGGKSAAYMPSHTHSQRGKGMRVVPIYRLSVRVDRYLA